MRYRIVLFVLIAIFYAYVGHDVTASSGTERYSEKFLRIEDRWKMIYSNGLEFRLHKPNQRDVAISWIVKSSPNWARQDSLPIDPVDFSTKDSKPFTEFTTKEHQTQLFAYNQKKLSWLIAEKKRYAKQLAQWQTEKKAYDKSESEKHSIEMDKWNQEKAVYDQDKKKQLLEWEEDQNKKKSKFLADLKKWQKEKEEYEAKEAVRYKKEKKELEEERDEDLADLAADIKKNQTVQKIIEQIRAEQKKCQSAEDKKKCNIELETLRRKHRYRNDAYDDYYIERIKILQGYWKNLKDIQPVAFEKSSSLFSNREKPVEKNYLVEKPVIKTFRARPEKPRDFVEIKPMPKKPRPFPEKQPKKDTAKGYDIGGLILYMGSTNCREGEFQLRKGRSHFYIASKKSKAIGSSDWSNSSRQLNLTTCQIVGRDRFSGTKLIQILYHDNRPLKITMQQTAYQLQKIESPKLVEFEAGIGDKEFFLRNLFEFLNGNPKTNKKETVSGRYIITENSKTRDLKIIYGATKKNVVKLEYKTFLHLFDSKAVSRDTIVHRVAYLQDGVFGEIKNPFLRRHYWYYQGGSPKNWHLLANYNYGILDDNSLGNQIALKERKANGGFENSKISATGLLTDFTSLMYIPAWCSIQGRDRMSLGYFDDNRLFGTVLTKQPDTSWIDFEEFEGFFNKVKVNRWILKSTSDGSILFEFYVGTENHIIYRIVSGNKQIELAKIRTDTINENIAWYNKILANNTFIRITN